MFSSCHCISVSQPCNICANLDHLFKKKKITQGLRTYLTRLRKLHCHAFQEESKYHDKTILVLQCRKYLLRNIHMCILKVCIFLDNHLTKREVFNEHVHGSSFVFSKKTTDSNFFQPIAQVILLDFLLQENIIDNTQC